MVKYTPNYSLGKPEGTDMYSILPQNANMDTLDTVLKGIETNASKAVNDSSLALEKSEETQQSVSEKLANTVTQTSNNLTYYINASSGSDNNDGVSNTSAFKTVQKALSILPQRINHVVTIILAHGTYEEDLLITSFDGSGQLRLVGGTSNANADSFALRSVSILNTNLEIRINYISVISTTRNTFVINNSSKVIVTGIVAIITSPFYGFNVSNSFVIIGVSIISNKNRAIVSSVSIVVSDVNSGVNNSVALYAEYGGTIAKAGSQPGGTTAETTIYGGVIR